MKTDFTINVQIGVTPELMSIMQMILQGRIAPEEETAELPQTAAAEEQQKPAEQPQKVDTGAQPTETQQPQAAEEPKLAPTAEDVRTAMHRTRQRIEGDDYKDNTDSDAYKRYHRALTAEFKKISAFLGSEKPSALPEDKRESFINTCEGLVVMDDGSIGQKFPF